MDDPLMENPAFSYKVIIFICFNVLKAIDENMQFVKLLCRVSDQNKCMWPRNSGFTAQNRELNVCLDLRLRLSLRENLPLRAGRRKQRYSRSRNNAQ